ncbi:hypothetical protein Tco_0794784 [Tanacetum coccineum]
MQLSSPDGPNVLPNATKQKPTCYESGAQENFQKRIVQKLKTTPLGNQGGNDNAPAKVYAVGRAGTNPDSNIITDLMPVELGSLDVIIGTDWLAKCQAVIVCTEKIVLLNPGNETIDFRDDGSDQGNETFRKEAPLGDVPTIRDFPEAFPEDLPGLPPTQQVEFQIDLIPGVAPIARVPYRLAPFEMKELSDQLQELSYKGFIRPSSSPWGAPILFVKKKDRFDLNIYIDYRDADQANEFRAARPTGGFRADYGFVATIDREIMWDLERDVGYGITDTWDEMLVDMQDTDEIYVRLDDEQTEQQLMDGRLNMLYRDRHAHARTALLMEREARMSREAWGRSMDASNLAHLEVTITELLEADRRRRAQFIAALKLLKALQTQMTEFQRQQGPAKGPAQPDAPEEAASKRITRSTPALAATNTTSVTNAQLQAMIDQGVTAALAARDTNRSTNGDDSHVSGTCVRRTEQVARECTYPDFMKCQPLNFKGTEGVVELIQWFEKMTVGHDVAYAMTWIDLKKKMTDKYCPRVEIKKLEAELWNLKVKESDKIKRYVGGLPDMIHRSVVASKPKIMQEAIEIATELVDNKIYTFVERQTENKRKQDDNHQQPQQQQNKRQNTG